MFATGTIHHVNAFEIVRHPWFMSVFLAGSIVQLLKFAVGSIRARRFRWRALVATGGMPSCHSALVSALAFAVGFTDGFDEPYAMIAFGLGLIVLIDAVTLRHEAGEHAKLLNRIIQHLNTVNDDDRIEARRLEEQLGHTVREMLAGVLFGGFVAFVVCAIWDFWK